jgi:hypothetical protein
MWPIERGKGLELTRPLGPPQRGLGSLEPNLGKQITVFICVDLHFICFPFFSLSKSYLTHIYLSWLPKLSTLTEQLLARRTIFRTPNYI